MLNEAEQTQVLKLAEALTGASQSGDNRTSSIISNVERRMYECECETLAEYIDRVDQDPEEKKNLISALTIHTTAWFRENPHFVRFHEVVLDTLGRREPFTVWCAACSTGEEVYSFALVLEEFRKVHSGFDYRIYGSDIDPVSIETAERGIYVEKQINFNLDRYKHHLLYGSGKTAELFTLSKEIRSRCNFRVHDLRSEAKHPNGPFDVVICRNVLIYFSTDGVRQVVGNILTNLKPKGHLFLGHSETVVANEFGITGIGHSVFINGKSSPAEFSPFAPEGIQPERIQPEKNQPEKVSGASLAKAAARPFPAKIDSGPITGSFILSKPGTLRPGVLSIDDNKAARLMIAKVLSDIGFDCETVETTEEASRILASKKFDLITLDLQIPGMEGGAWLLNERAKGLKSPVVIVSDVRKDDAKDVINLLGKHAQDYIEKADFARRSSEMRESLVSMVRGQSASKSVGDGKSVSALKEKPVHRPEVIVVGASTGGPQAIVKLLHRLPPDSPPVLVVQHISAKFSSALAERIAAVSGLRIGRMENGEELQNGHLYFALDDYHIGIEKDRRGLVLKVSHDQPVNRHRPSVDFLFRSVAVAEKTALAILLTGMGRDGAAGLKMLKDRGSFCVAQGEEDCIVFGMPREAISLGAASFVGTIDEIRSVLFYSITLKRHKEAI